MEKTQTWKDKSDHPRCNVCGSRVRTKPRSSRLKTLLREHLAAEKALAENRAKTTVKGNELEYVTCRV